MARTLAGEIRPTLAAAFPPLAINIECQDPAAFPCLPHYEAAARLRAAYEQRTATGPLPRGTVLSTSIVLGFPYADVPEMGSIAIVVTNADPVAAYGEVCPEFIRVNTPGVTTADLSRLHYRHSRQLLVSP